MAIERDSAGAAKNILEEYRNEAEMMIDLAI